MMIYGVGGQIIEAIQAFYREMSAYVKMDGELSDSITFRVGMRQG